MKPTIKDILSNVNSVKMYMDKNSTYYAEVYFLDNTFKAYISKSFEYILEDILYRLSGEED